MIFFDIDGTLMDHPHAEAAGALGFRGEYTAFESLTPEEFTSLWHHLAEKHMNRFLAGDTDNRGQRRDRLRELFATVEAEIDDIDAAFEHYLSHYRAHWRLYPDALTCLDALDGRPLGIISNGDSAAQRAKLDRLEIADRFEVVAISGDIGVAKPEAALCRHACTLAGAEPDACHYVGDRVETDVLAAGRAGLGGIHLDRHGERHPAVRSITSLEELPALLATGATSGM